ncbi:MAG TPA: hypothetical protein VK042_04540 [Atopostipes sp.]|nr:hypothetical protein [Atopostipes sp.]
MSKERLEEIKENMEKFKTTKSVREFEEVAAEMLLNHGTWLVEQAERVQELENQNERYREALEFYGDEKVWTRYNQQGNTEISLDGGNKARKALEGEE